MKKTMIAVLLFISILQAGITFGTGSRVFIYDANISVYGNLKNLGGVITPVSTSKFTFVGSAQDTITNITTFPNLAISKPSGSVRLNNGSGSFTITGSISFTGGNVITGTNTFELDTTATVTGESTAGYIIGTTKAARVVGTGSNTFGGIGYSINNTGSNLGTVTVYRYTGDGSDVVLYGSEGIWRKWNVETSVAFSGTRQVTTSWLSNEDNGNVLANLKVWKYETAKSSTKDDNNNSEIRKIKIENKVASKSLGREITSLDVDEVEEIIIEEEPKTLGWVEVDGVVFNTTGSPRTATYTISAATQYTINDVANAFADGAGTESNPYQIATLDQLNAVRYYPSAHFIQIADIDASSTLTWNSGAGWAPIPNFAGKYNGDGHTVSNLYISRSVTSYIGLFGQTNSGSEIKDLGLENVDFTGGDYTGGLIGMSRGTIRNCYSRGQINSSTGYLAGGFVGYATTGNNIYDCYANVEVTRSSGGTYQYVGGFCGYHGSGQIYRCYSTGAVHYEGSTDPTNRGFTSYTVGTVSGNFWNTETSGQLTSVGATGLTKTQMRTISTFTNATWDFQDESANGVEDIWGINAVENSGYPFLSWEGITHNPSPFAGGIGTSDEPFLVSNLTQLDAVRDFKTYNFIQNADIDASETLTWDAGAGWMPIGTSFSDNFTGVYNGNEHTITGLFINRPSTSYQALFGRTEGATIMNLGVKESNITGDRYVGSIVGLTSSTIIENCFTDGQTKGNIEVGGFVGRNSSNSTIENCYANGSVTRAINQTSTLIGGFVGANYNMLNNSYSTASVHYENVTDPTDRGFTGSNTGTMTGNFWNIETSGQSTSGGTATGLTNTEMRTLSTFTGAGWDFYGESANGTNDYWNMHTSLNSGFPYLNWEYRIAVEAPANLALSIVGTDVIITWDAVTGAADYYVYSSEDPYGLFTLNEDGVFAGEQWTGPFAGTKMFYYVTAINDTKVIAAKTININGNSNR